MVIVTIGTNDIIAIYEQRRDGTLTTDALAIAEARSRGTVAAQQINRMLARGARALVLTTPVIGQSPYAVTAEAANPGAAALITQLTTDFNAALRRGIDQTDYDGRHYGLVLADDITAAMARYPTSYLASPANKTTAQCATDSLPQGCVVVIDSDGVAPDNNVRSNTYLWATDRLLGPVALGQIGSQTLSRAMNNPF
jgi:hypothetical protein